MVEISNAVSLENVENGPVIRGWHTYLSVGVTVAVFAVLGTMVDLGEVWKNVARCNIGFLTLGALAHYATYPIRGFRWHRCLRHLPIECGKAKLGLLVFFYNSVDNVVPAKLGDLYGAHLARINCGIRRSAALGSIVFLRMVDAWVVFVLALLGSWLLFSERLPQTVFWVLIGGGGFAAVVTVMMMVFFWLKRSLPGWLPENVREMIRAFQTGMWPRGTELVCIAALTALIWTLETLWIFFLARSFGLKLGAAESIFMTMIPVIATAFPLTPSGAGAVELTFYGSLRVLGVSSPFAVSLTVVNRFVDYWLHIGLGALMWAVRGKIGLRTWRDEVPHQDLQDMDSLRSLSKQEGFS